MLISIRADIKKITRQLEGLAREQIPFATAQAVTAIAQRAADAERQAMSRQLDRPTPFTLKGIGVLRATKRTPTATLFIKDIQARYLAPEIKGGVQVLGKGGSARAILQPVDARVNQYGNIPKGMLARLKGRNDVFIGTVQSKQYGPISGVWQRLPYQRGQTRYSKGNFRGRLKLLLRFADPKPVKTRYRWGDAVKRTVDSAAVAAAFEAALTKALATAR